MTDQRQGMPSNFAKGVHRELGLTDDEFSLIEARMGRLPNDLELAMFSVMWSEHCSYKSSRIHLARLPTTGEKVLVGPGENAGVLDVGDGLAIAIRIESHNHPSFVEPYQGAATGVGGILRDIFTMGARPIALMDPLFVGPLSDAHSAYLLDGIVRGVAGYGNAIGVPTIGGQITFADCYRTNPLVNVFCLGLLEQSHLVLGQASGVGNLVVLLGSRTGRDGIGGVSVLASAGFRSGEEDAAKRPSVQIGDPYEEKRLLEACLSLLDEHLVVGLQDLGGAGLSCATSETAARAGLGMDVDIDAVPRREAEMSPIEVMTSESQERMLAIVAPDSLERVLELCRRWEVDASVIGTVTEPTDGIGRLRIFSGSVLLASMPAAALADEAPKYDRPRAAPVAVAAQSAEVPAGDRSADLLALLADPSWIFRQYDHQLYLNTVLGPGEADATVLRLAAPGIAFRGKGLALSSDASPSWCAIDPRIGTMWTVAESALNVACAGATPLGLVNCLNFGNPEHESVMWQLSESIDGMAEACRALEIPVVGGNVSLYNESEGRDIDPTPVVTVVGLIERLDSRPPALCWSEADSLVLLGERRSSLAGSRFAGRLGLSMPPTLDPIDLDAHARLCALVARLVVASTTSSDDPLVHAVHDISDGGIAVALAECAIASGLGASIALVMEAPEAFSEAPSRVIVATARPEEVIEAAQLAGVPAARLGLVQGGDLEIPGVLRVNLRDLVVASHATIAGVLEGSALSAVS